MKMQFTQNPEGIIITIPSEHLKQIVETNPYHPIIVDKEEAFAAEVLQELSQGLDNNGACTSFQRMLNEACFEAVINNNGKGARMMEIAGETTADN